ncbi:putative sodium-dependent transporter YocR [Branchiostoma floridae x Branchiostoma japonicum]
MADESSPLVRKDKSQNEGGSAFTSSLGAVITCLASAIGTGNIWRFPRIIANNSGEKGCLQFLIAWVPFLILWCVPVLVIEYGVGRYTRKATVLSFARLLGPMYGWLGAWIVLTSFIIGCFYAVIVGWYLYYLIITIGWELPSTHGESEEIFRHYTEQTALPILTHAIIVVMTAFALLYGVKIFEPLFKVMIPLLLVLMFATFIWSMTLPHATAGVTFTFSADWEEIGKPGLWVDALVQNAWDTGSGSGLFLVLATYMTRTHGVVRYSTMVPVINDLVSLMCSLTLFGVVFSFYLTANPGMPLAPIVDLLKENGPANTGLTLIWVPILYGTMTGGRVLCAIFFLCVLMAGWSSHITIVESVVRNIEDFGVPRKLTVLGVTILMFLIGLPSALDINFLVNQDFVWGFSLLFCGTGLTILALKFGVRKFRDVVINEYGYLFDWHLPVVWIWVIRLLIPAQALFIFIWWTIEQIQSEVRPWYELWRESLMMCWVQWAGAVIVLLGCNLILVRYWPDISYRWGMYRQHIQGTAGSEKATEITMGGDVDSPLVLTDNTHAYVSVGADQTDRV